MGAVELARKHLVLAGPIHQTWSCRVWALHLDCSIRFEVEGAAVASDGYLRLELMVDRLGVADPCVVPWAPVAVRAHLGAGRIDDAERICNYVERAAATLTATWPQFCAMAGRAGVAAARGDHMTAQRLWSQATEMAVPLPLERARVLLDYGAWLRRTNRPVLARSPLAEALALAERAGAQRLAAQAAAELRVAGGRRRARLEAEQLTPQESRVTELAAEGLTNAELAQRLSLSVKTIETHLTRIYRKLGVGSKRELCEQPQGDGQPVWDLGA
jgi:DNA-binding CsgD family transcriptional regulator